MKRILLLMTALAAVAAQADNPPSYSLGIPGAPTIRCTSDASQNAWLASNSVASVSASFGASGGPAVSATVTPGLDRYMLAASESGFSVERIKPEVWLGDVIAPPADVDWNATYAEYCTNETEQAKFIFDNVGKRVYVQAGGSLVFKWIGLDGSVTERTYIASGATSGRPFKMFWTESPWNAPSIDLSGKFVKLFGPDELIKVQRGERIKDTGGYSVVESNVVVKGVYLDPSAHTLAAYGRVSGQFILAYYDSGSYNTLKHVQVIEVGEPDVVEMKGHVGEPIAPHGTGYSTKGLWPSPIASTSSTTQEDEFGPYYYQHKGLYSYSPKHNSIFPLRETADAPWRIDVYWMEEDAYGVSWPFERCQYGCSWNTNAIPVLVAGDSVKIPDAYTASLNKYQVPNGHARAPKDNVFTATADGFASPTDVGYSCLKLATTDNVWFLPIRTVGNVGEELVPRTGSESGTAGGYEPDIDLSVPGMINLSESGTHYNPNLYYDWTTKSNEYQSVIYAVNTSKEDKPIEVHWFTTKNIYSADMPEKVAIPCLVQRYGIVYPEPTHVPQIVIASQKGGAGESVFEDGIAMSFDSTTSVVELPAAQCFSSNSMGVVTFWADARKMAEASDATVLRLASSSSSLEVKATRSASSVQYVASLSGAGAEVTFGTGDVPADGWHCITFVVEGASGFALVDGDIISDTYEDELTTVFPTVSAFMTDNRLGGEANAPKGLVIDNIEVGAFDLTEDAEQETLYDQPDAGDYKLALCLSFPEETDLGTQRSSNVRKVTEEVSGRICPAVNVSRVDPGSPCEGNGVFLADSRPIIYRQPDPSLPGYNPNEEHAFIGSGSGGYFAWALRCDLNTEETSKPRHDDRGNDASGAAPARHIRQSVASRDVLGRRRRSSPGVPGPQEPGLGEMRRHDTDPHVLPQPGRLRLRGRSGAQDRRAGAVALQLQQRQARDLDVDRGVAEERRKHAHRRDTYRSGQRPA